MDVKKIMDLAGKAIDKVEQAIDGKDSTSVWANTTRVGGTPVGSVPVSRQELEFLVEVAEEHGVPAIQRYAASLRKKYLGTS